MGDQHDGHGCKYICSLDIIIYSTQKISQAKYGEEFPYDKLEKGQGLPPLVASIVAEYTEANNLPRAFNTNMVSEDDERIQGNQGIAMLVEKRPIPEVENLGEDQWWNACEF